MSEQEFSIEVDLHEIARYRVHVKAEGLPAAKRRAEEMVRSHYHEGPLEGVELTVGRFGTKVKAAGGGVAFDHLTRPQRALLKRLVGGDPTFKHTVGTAQARTFRALVERGLVIATIGPTGYSVTELGRSVWGKGRS